MSIDRLGENDNFLERYQTRIREFLATIHNQLDSATEGNENDGALRPADCDDNVYAVEWQAERPLLPGDLEKLQPFKLGEKVGIRTGYRYGTKLASINIEIKSLNGEEDSREFQLRLLVNPETGEVELSLGGNDAGSAQTGRVAVTEVEVRILMTALFGQSETYKNHCETEDLNFAHLFQLGIATRADNGAELCTTQQAGKEFATPFRWRDGEMQNGFDLSVRVYDRDHPNGKSSETRIVLFRQFESQDYSTTGLYDGGLTQELIIEQSPTGKVTNITRGSKVILFDQVQIVEDGEVAGATEVAIADMPPGLACRLYPNRTPTLGNLDFFERLVTQPIEESDCYIDSPPH